jgi:intracellular sulfur oxidation DsrE/DsrF family protein
MLDRKLPSHRRGFLASVGATFALGAVGAMPLNLERLAPAVAGGPDPDTSDRWLSDLKGKHRQLFDMPAPSGGSGLLHVRNWYSTWHDAYALADKDMNALVTLYGKSLPLGFEDAMWEKYHFGELLKENGPDKQPLTRNMFFRPQQGDPLAYGFLDASVESLQKRGARFILCNNALNFWSQRLSQGGAGTTAAIRTDLLDHMLPGVVLVPGMVVAINKAQERGFSYMYLD